MIPFTIPAKFATSFATGQLVLYGALLKDTSTGKIVGHLQETSVLEHIMQGAFSAANASLPLNAIGIVQNQHMVSQLKDIQAELGLLNGLQIANLATSVVGIGVTVTSAVVIINRLKAVNKSVIAIGEKVDKLGDEMMRLELEKHLADLETEVERAHELPLRKNTAGSVESSEKKLHQLASQFFGLANFCAKPQNDNLQIDLLWQITSALGLVSSLGLQMLIASDELPVAHERAVTLYKKFAAFNRLLPEDYIVSRVDDKESAIAFSSCLTEIRHHLVTMPSFIRSIQATGSTGST